MWTPPFSSDPAVLIGPVILMLFTLAMVGAWSLDRRREELLVGAAAAGFFLAGVLVQAFEWPREAAGAMAAAALYTAATLSLIEAMLRRARREIGLAPHAAGFAAVMAATAWFAYIQPSLLAQLLVQDIAYGLFLLIAAIRLRVMLAARLPDRILYILLLALTAHFAPRIILTIEADRAGELTEAAVWVILHLSVVGMGAAMAFALLGATLRDLIEELRRERDLDPLTGLCNRRGFERQAQKLLVRSRPATALIADIDRFKTINDRYGHAGGDAVIAAFAQTLRAHARPGEALARLGGEEFALLTTISSPDDMAARAEALRQACTLIRVADAPDLALTASFGTARRQGGEPLSTLLDRADRRLYAAKRAGRNRVVSRDAPDAAPLAMVQPDGAALKSA